VRLLPALRSKQEVERGANDALLSFDEFVGLVTQFGFNGVQYTTPATAQEQIAPAFAAMARFAYKTNGVVFACMTVRQQLLAQARFAFRERQNGRPGNLFTTDALAPLETPWANATTGDLISRMEMFASLAGNFFGTNRYGGIRPLRPDWMKILVGSDEGPDSALWDPDAQVVGYAYQPGGPGSGRPIVTFLPEEIAHYAPIPDPEAQFRGMSWLTPIARDVMADKAATDHKLMFFENGATPNMVVKMDVDDISQWVNWIRKFKEDHEGVGNAYKTLFLGAGMDATVVGKDFQQMEFKVTQGAGETRIAAAAGTPPVVVGLSEGLQGSSLNAGNFEASMARLRDVTIRPLLQNMAGSLATLVPPPHSGAELWYDDRDVPAFQEDIRKAGERLQADTTAMSTLITAGYDPDSVTDAVTSGDLSRLTHTGLPSVQLQPGATNGNGAKPQPEPTPA